MSLGNSPSIITNGLVFYYDMYNNKSFKGAPITNYAYHQNPRVDKSYPTYSATSSGTWTAKHSDAIRVYNDNGDEITDYVNTGVGDWTNTYHAIWSYDDELARPVVIMRDYDGGQWKAKSYGLSTSFSGMGLSNGSQYTISWLQWTDNISSSPNVGIYRYSTSNGYWNFWDGLSNVQSTSYNTQAKTWQRVYATFTINSAADIGSSIACYMYGQGTGCIIKIADVQITATPYNTGFSKSQTRTNTQSLLDLTNNNTITTNSLTYDSDGSFSFNGSNYISTNYTEALGDFTIGVWFKANGNTGGYDRIIDKLYTTGFWLGRNASSANSWGGGVLEGSSPYGIFLTLTDGQWHYLVSVRQGTTHTLYGDGITNTVSNTVSSSALNTNPIGIGSWYDHSTQYFNGNIPIVQVYNRALTPSQILQNFNAHRRKFGI